MPSDIDGYYFDPKHGGCLRRVTTRAGRTVVHGVYGDDELAGSFGPWVANVRELSRSVDGRIALEVDFEGKAILTHKPLYRATFDPRRRIISWQDGNIWRRMFTHPTQLRARPTFFCG